MPLKNYGAWKATPTHFKAQRSDEDANSPHGSLEFQDGKSPKKLSSAINVKSLSENSSLVYWLIEDFKHPIQNLLRPLDLGWHDIPESHRRPGSMALDLLRGHLVNVEEGRIVPHDLPDERNDIVDFLDPFFQKAIQENATVYIFGEQYRGKDGVHDVHMNQGSAGRFTSSNGTYQDGGIILEFKDGHWEVFFIAFASQTMTTDDGGQVAGPSFAEFLAIPGGGNQPVPGEGSGIGSGRHDNDSDHHNRLRSLSTVVIEAALVNPEGRDNEDNPEQVHLLNTGSESTSLRGWTIGNQMGNKYELPADASILPSGKKVFEVPGVLLSNKGGSIMLFDDKGHKVDQVQYSAQQAAESGALIYFRSRNSL